MNIKYKGNGLLAISIIACAVVALAAVSFTKIFSAGWSWFSERDISLNVQKLAVSVSDELRSSAYSKIPEGETDKVFLKQIGENRYYKSVSTSIITDEITEEKAKKSIVKVFVNDELDARVTYDIRRNEKSMPLYSNLDTNEDGALTQKSLQDNFILKEDGLKRETGMAVGSTKQATYSANNKLEKADFIFDSSKAVVSDEIAVWDGDKIKYRLRNNVIPEMIADYKLDSSGYIRFINGIVFAWTRHVITSDEKAKRIAIVPKPIQFYTLIAQPADCTPYTDSVSYYGWVNKELNKSYDRFYTTNNDKSAEMTVWWIGSFKEADTSGEIGEEMDTNG